jgi:hypothetical protein
VVEDGALDLRATLVEYVDKTRQGATRPVVDEFDSGSPHLHGADKGYDYGNVYVIRATAACPR